MRSLSIFLSLFFMLACNTEVKFPDDFGSTVIHHDDQKEDPESDTLSAIQVGESNPEEGEELPPPPVDTKITMKDIVEWKQKRLFRIFRLQDRDQVISDRVRQLVRMDLEKRLRDGLLEDQENFDILVRLSLEDLQEAMTERNGESSIEVTQDLDEATKYARLNNINFFRHFSEAILMAFDRMEQLGQLYQDSEFGSTYRNTAKLCTLALNHPSFSLNFENLSNEVEKEVRKKDLTFIQSIKARCNHIVLGPNEKGQTALDWESRPIEVVFSERVSQPIKERMCSYRRWLNKRRLVEFTAFQPPIRYKEEN